MTRKLNGVPCRFIYFLIVHLCRRNVSHCLRSLWCPTCNFNLICPLSYSTVLLGSSHLHFSDTPGTQHHRWRNMWWGIRGILRATPVPESASRRGLAFIVHTMVAHQRGVRERLGAVQGCTRHKSPGVWCFYFTAWSKKYPPLQITTAGGSTWDSGALMPRRAHRR